jgi:DNA polymerase
MSLQRTRLLLDEMGIGPAWMLRAVPAAPAPSKPVAATELIVAESARAQPVSAQAIAAMDWDQLSAAVASCTRCTLCQGRRSAVFGRGARGGAMIVLGSGPGSADEEAGAPLSGMPGQLLDNMLAAIAVAPQHAYVTNLVKCTAQAQGRHAAPTQQQRDACRPYLERELALLTQARTLLVLGQPAARALGLAAPALRGAVHKMGALAVVATLDLESLLEQGPRMAQDRASVWADLCLARGVHDASA